MHALSFCLTCFLFQRYFRTDLCPVLWHCWLGVRKSIWPVKSWEMRCWRGYLSGGMCNWFAHGPANANATPSSRTCFIKIQIGLTSVMSAYAECPGKEAVKRVSVVTWEWDWFAIRANQSRLVLTGPTPFVLPSKQSESTEGNLRNLGSNAAARFSKVPNLILRFA